LHGFDPPPATTASVGGDLTKNTIQVLLRDRLRCHLTVSVFDGRRFLRPRCAHLIPIYVHSEVETSIPPPLPFTRTFFQTEMFRALDNFTGQTSIAHKLSC
jgi:hypothetical protein